MNLLNCPTTTFVPWWKTCVRGLPVATPVFDGAKEREIKALLKLADLPESGQISCSTVVPVTRSSKGHRGLCTC